MASTPDKIGATRHEKRARERGRHHPGSRYGLGSSDVVDILGRFGQGGSRQ
jgi:hypothetical protein